MAAKKKRKPTKNQIIQELSRASREYEHLTNALWNAALYNVAKRLGVEVAEIEDDFGSLT